MKYLEEDMVFLWFQFFILAALNPFSYGDPNIVLVITDDQDLLLNGMIPMKNTINLVANEGKTFQNAYVNTPVCCPSRSTILTGKFAHNTGVVNNSLSGNCSSTLWQSTHEPYSIASILKKDKNYVTYYSGKYLNQYGSEEAGGIEHIPEGYDWWIGLKGNSVYYNYTLSINGTKYFSSDKYLTDTLVEYSLKFLEQRATDRPFFMVITPPAPHAPFTPAKRHENKFAGIKAVRNPSFNHSGLDKHWLIRMPPEYLPDDVTILDKVQQHRLESLLAVDELVEKVVTKLELLNLLDETYIIFTSDHGYHIGQFSQPWDKRQPYQTDIRVPFIIRGPNVPVKSLEAFPISSVDIAPTILALAEVDIPIDMDGNSFKERLFAEESNSFVKTILIEYWGEGDEEMIDTRCPWTYDPNLTQCTLDQWCKCQDSRNNTYSCIVEFKDDEHFKFCSFNDQEDFLEAYNLTTDPFELENIANNLITATKHNYLKLLENIRKCKGRDCQEIDEIFSPEIYVT